MQGVAATPAVPGNYTAGWVDSAQPTGRGPTSSLTYPSPVPFRGVMTATPQSTALTHQPHQQHRHAGASGGVAAGSVSRPVAGSLPGAPQSAPRPANGGGGSILERAMQRGLLHQQQQQHAPAPAAAAAAVPPLPLGALQRQPAGSAMGGATARSTSSASSF